MRRSKMIGILVHNKYTGVLSAILLVVAALLHVSFAFFLGRIVEASIDLDMDLFANNVIIAVLIIVVASCSELIGQVYRSKFAMKTGVEYKNELLKKILELNVTRFNDENHSYYLNVLTEETGIIQDHYFMQFIAVIQNATQVLFGIGALLIISWKFTVVVFGLFFLPLLVPSVLGPILGNRRQAATKSNESYIINIKGILEGFEVIKTFGLYNRISEQFTSKNSSLERMKFEFEKVNSSKDVMTGALTQVSQMGAIAVGVYLIFQGEMSVPVLFAGVQIIGGIIYPIEHLSRRYAWIIGTRPLREKHALLLEDASVDKIDGVSLKKVGEIKLKDVCFAYQNNQILRNCSFTFTSGKKYALLGASGSGKSTLLKILMGHYGNYKGQISFGDVDLKKVDLSSLYKFVSAIHQNVFLFDDTLRNNITLYRMTSEEGYNEVLKQSNLCQLASRLEECALHDNGSSLSGGEKQRVSVARSLLNQSELLLVDEATASLDKKNALQVYKTLTSLKNVTCIAVTHNRSEEVLSLFDEIIELRDGHIESIKQHEVIMENSLAE